MLAAKALGATAVKYPKPPADETAALDGAAATGMRVGIIARDYDADAWDVALARSRRPARSGDARPGDEDVGLAMAPAALAAGRVAALRRRPYWLGPNESYKTFCPYLVSSCGRVAAELERVSASRIRDLLLVSFLNEEELEHIVVATDRASLRFAEAGAEAAGS